MPLVWSKPDGSVLVTQIADAVVERERQEGESTADVVMRLAATIQAKTPSLAGATPALVPSANMPATRAKRAGWRLSGGAVVEDNDMLFAAQDVAQQQAFDANKMLVALARWTAGKLGVPLPQARTEILAIYRAITS